MRSIPIETRIDPLVLALLIRYVKENNIALPRWTKSSILSWALQTFAIERAGELLQTESEADLLMEIASFGAHTPSLSPPPDSSAGLSKDAIQAAYEKFKKVDPLDKQSKKIMQNGGDKE